MSLFDSLFNRGGAAMRDAAERQAAEIRRRSAQEAEAQALLAEQATMQIKTQQERDALAARAEEEALRQGNQPDVEISLGGEATDPLAATKRRKQFFNVGQADGGLSI